MIPTVGLPFRPRPVDYRNVVVGGFCKVFFCPADNVRNITWDPSSGKIKKIDLVSGGFWMDIDPIKKGSSFKEQMKTDSFGTYYQQDLAATIPGDSLPANINHTVLDYFRYLVLIRLRNGVMKLAGDINYPLFLQQSYTTDEIDGVVSRLITFTGLSLFPAQTVADFDPLVLRSLIVNGKNLFVNDKLLIV